MVPLPVELVLDDLAIGGQTTSVETITSAHTGRMLQRFGAELYWNNPAGDSSLDAYFKGKRRTPLRGRVGDLEGEWAVDQLSWSSGGGRSPRIYQVRMTQWENRHAEKLTLGRLEVTPFKYRERMRDEAILTIKAAILIDTHSFNEIAQLARRREYFAVRRIPVSEEPRSMRFGTILWSTHGDTRKCDLVLVDRAIDERDEEDWPQFVIEPAFSNLRRQAIQDGLRLQNLLRLLEQKKVLTADEARALTRVSPDEEFDRAFQLTQVGDVDDWLTDYDD